MREAKVENAEGREKNQNEREVQKQTEGKSKMRRDQRETIKMEGRGNNKLQRQNQ